MESWRCGESGFLLFVCEPHHQGSAPRGRSYLDLDLSGLGASTEWDSSQGRKGEFCGAKGARRDRKTLFRELSSGGRPPSGTSEAG